MSGSGPGGDAPRWDPPITVALLLGGLISVTQVVAAARDLPAFLDQTYAAAGMGDFKASALVTGIGYAIVAVQMIALVAAIAVCVPRLRAHRMTFWVPLLAGSGCTAITIALLFVAIATNPAELPTASRTFGP